MAILLDDILYVTEQEPCTFDHQNAHTIYVQEEYIDSFKELNNEVADKIYPYNYFILRVTEAEWKKYNRLSLYNPYPNTRERAIVFNTYNGVHTIYVHTPLIGSHAYLQDFSDPIEVRQIKDIIQYLYNNKKEGTCKITLGILDDNPEENSEYVEGEDYIVDYGTYQAFERYIVFNTPTIGNATFYLMSTQNGNTYITINNGKTVLVKLNDVFRVDFQ